MNYVKVKRAEIINIYTVINHNKGMPRNNVD